MTRFYECGICEHLHPWEWAGDCRDDSSRFTHKEVEALPNYDIVLWDDRVRADRYGDHVLEEA